MNRLPLRIAVESYTSPDQAQILFKHQILNFIQSTPTCFDRLNLAGHITGSAWLLNKTGDKALLMHHRKLDLWCQLGGHADGDPDIPRVALKEAKEESGIEGIRLIGEEIFDLDVHEIPARADEPSHLHFDIRYLMQVVSDEDFQLNQESRELRWIGKNISELPTDDASVVRMFNKWVAFQ